MILALSVDTSLLGAQVAQFPSGFITDEKQTDAKANKWIVNHVYPFPDTCAGPIKSTDASKQQANETTSDELVFRQ